MKIQKKNSSEGDLKMRKENSTLEAAKQYIERNYQNPNLSQEMVSSTVGVKRTTLSNLFKRLTGQTYVSYLRAVRMEKAVGLLADTDEKVWLLARKVGIEDVNYFSFLFKKQYGISPGQYRKQQKRAQIDCKTETDEKELLIKRAKRYIQKHYPNAKLSEETISQELNISRIYFSSLFRKITGQTYVSYLKEVRMQEAARLLVQTREKVYVIAEKVGFEDTNYFSFIFKKYYGISPSQYRDNDQTEELVG